MLQSEQPLEFALKRIFRIYPLFITALLIQTLIHYQITKAPISLQTLVPQLLLMGDIFKVPYMLLGVEWTLRIEVAFYVLMFCMRYAGLLSTYQRFFPGILILLTYLLGIVTGIPDGSYGGYGYWNMYAPFLLLGSAFLLYEKKSASGTFLVFFASFVLIQCWQLTIIYSPGLKDMDFVSLGFLVFLTAWLFRDSMHMNRLGFLFLN